LSEQSEQIRLAKRLDRAGIFYSATANGGQRVGRGGEQMKASGVKAGVPDLLIFDPPPSGGVGLAIEMKAPKAPRPGKVLGADGKHPRWASCVSAHQKRWLAELERRGWIVAVCYSCADAVELMEGLGYHLGVARRRMRRDG